MARRIQRRRTKGWRMPEGAVYVGRPSGFGNPFRADKAAEAGHYGPARGAVTAYRDWLDGNPWACPSNDHYAAQRNAILSALPSLRGRDLVCWCPLDHACHADVLLELANGDDDDA